MRKTLSVLILLGLAAIALPMAAAALGLDIEAKAGAGVALGATDNSSISGSPRIAAGGGVGLDFYLVNLGPIDLGIAIGGEYSYLTFHSVWSDFPFAGEDQTTDAVYNYVNIPIALVCRVPINESIQVVVRAGGFIGYFLNGTADITFTTLPTPPRTTLDSSNTIRWEYGLHFTAGADIALGSGISLAPAVQFDMGLTDTSVNSAQPTPSKDTFWSLTAIVGIKYKVL